MASGADGVPEARGMEEVADRTGLHLSYRCGELCAHRRSADTGGHEEDTWSGTWVPHDAVDVEVLHAVAALLQYVDGATKAVAHLPEVAHILNYHDEWAEGDGAQEHAFPSVKAVDIFAAVVVASAAALALKGDGDDIALVHWEDVEGKRLVHVVSDDGYAW